MGDVQLTLKLDKKSMEFLKGFPDKFQNQFREGLKDSMFYAEGYAKRSFGTSPSSPNQPPGVISGHLRRSVVGVVEKVGGRYIGVLGSNVLYARPLEFGRAEGGLEERPFIRPALENNMDTFSRLIAQALLRSV